MKGYFWGIIHCRIQIFVFKAYIPLRRKTTGVGASCQGADPKFPLPIPTCSFLKTVKFALPLGTGH